MSQDGLRIVDAHHHLWDLEGSIRYPWLTEPHPSRHGDYSAFCRTYLPDEYRRDTALHDVIATVHVEAECARDQQVDETRWLTELNARYGMPNVIVAHAWLDTPDAARARRPVEARHIGEPGRKRSRATAIHAG